MKTMIPERIKAVWVGAHPAVDLSTFAEEGFDVKTIPSSDIYQPIPADTDVVMLTPSSPEQAVTFFSRIDEQQPSAFRVHALIAGREFMGEHLLKLRVLTRIDACYHLGTDAYLIATHLRISLRDQLRLLNPASKVA